MAFTLAGRRGRKRPEDIARMSRAAGGAVLTSSEVKEITGSPKAARGPAFASPMAIDRRRRSSR